MVSNDSLTALEWFGLESGFPRRYSGGGANYNDVFRWVYDALFDLNLEADVVPADAGAERLARYDVLIAPGAFVNVDVPSGSTVIGNPGVVHLDHPCPSEYVQNPWEGRSPRRIAGR